MPAALFFRVTGFFFELPFAGYGECAVLHADVDVLELHVGDVRLHYQLVLGLPNIDRGHPWTAVGFHKQPIHGVLKRFQTREGVETAKRCIFDDRHDVFSCVDLTTRQVYNLRAYLSSISCEIFNAVQTTFRYTGPMRIGMIGLGKMGGNMAQRLTMGGHEVIAYDPHPPDAARVKEMQASLAPDLAGLVAQLSAPRTV